MQGAIAQIKHRTASRNLDSCWEYDPVRRVVIARLSLGGEPRDLEIPVCSQKKPVADRWISLRLGGSEWVVMPVLWPRDSSRVARSQPFLNTPGFPVGSLVLLSAPPDVQADLALLESP